MNNLPTFSGYDSEDATQFFHLLEAYFAVKRILDNDVQLQILGAALRGPALVTYRNVNWNNLTVANDEEAEPATYEERKEYLLELYNTTQKKMQNLIRLQTMRMGVHESPSDFYNRLLLAASRAGESGGKSVDTIFLSGLSPEIRQRVLEMGAADIVEQLRIAQNIWTARNSLTLNNYDDPYTPRITSHLPTAATSNLAMENDPYTNLTLPNIWKQSNATNTHYNPTNVQAKPANLNPKQNERTEIEKLTEAFEKLSVNLTQVLTTQTTPRQNNYQYQNKRNNNYERRNNFSNRNTKTCNACKESGHFMKDCPLFQQFLQTQQVPQTNTRSLN